MYPTRELLSMHPVLWASTHFLFVLSAIGLYIGFILLQKAQALFEKGNHHGRDVKLYAFTGYFLVLSGLALMMKSVLTS